MTEAQSIATDLKADGQAIMLIRTTPGQADPASGTIGDPVEQQWTVYGITSNYNSKVLAASKGLILQGDKKATISATVKPRVNDLLKIMGEKWRIMAFDDLSPQGETLLYTCQIRR